MNVHEHQAKELLRRFGVITPRGFACFGVDDAVAAAQRLGGERWVVKAQIHAGGRGKAGGVPVASSIDEVREHASRLLGMRLITSQTGPDGRPVKRLLIEEAVDFGKAFYVGMVVDRTSQRVALMASSDGGVDIEAIAQRTPEKIHKVCIDPFAGLEDSEADDIARKIGMPDTALAPARAFMQSLYRAFDACDATLAEINPTIVTGDARVMALDARLSFDDNALFRQPEIAALRDPDEEDAEQLEASKFDLAYVSLDGNIGCLVNGAGLAMATMDAIKLYGGSPANFLDVGGSATTQQVTEAFKLMLHNPSLRAILVNVYGGIMRCDVIASGVVAAARQVALKVPLVVRMKGSNENAGKSILAQSGLPVIAAHDMAEAAEKVVAAARGR